MRKLTLSALFILLSLPAFSFAAIAYDSTCSNQTSATSNSFSCTNTAGNFMACIVAVHLGANITSFTYNSVALTQVDTNVDGTFFNLYSYYLQVPATGSNTLTLNIDASQSMWVSCDTYSGAATSGQPDNHTGQAGSGNALTTSVTVNTLNSWTWLGSFADKGSLAASTGSTARGTGLSAIEQGFDSNAALSTGSHSMSVTATSGNINTVMFSIKPAVASAATAPFFWSWWW
jgi:hypothetical protein